MVMDELLWEKITFVYLHALLCSYIAVLHTADFKKENSFTFLSVLYWLSNSFFFDEYKFWDIFKKNNNNTVWSYRTLRGRRVGVERKNTTNNYKMYVSRPQFFPARPLDSVQ